MLKRFASLILALVIGGGVLAAPPPPLDNHGCEMAGVEARGVETTPCCKEHESRLIFADARPACCFTTPQETASRGTTFNLRSPSFNIAVVHPAVLQSPPRLPKIYSSSYSSVLPDQQHSYVRNLSLLI